MTAPQSANESDLQQLIESILPEIRNSVQLACLIYKHSASEDEIDDLYQGVVLLLIEDDYRRLRSFSCRSSLKTWLRKVVMHYVLRHLQRRRVEASLEEIPPSSAIYQTDEDDAIWREQLLQLVQAAISQLSEREQQMFELCLRDDLKVPDIAELMGIKSYSAYARKSALIRKVRKFLGMGDPGSGIEKFRRRIKSNKNTIHRNGARGIR